MSSVATSWARQGRLRWLALVTLGLPACLWGQTANPEADLQQACEQSRSDLASRKNDENVRRAVVNIQSCSADAAAGVLADAWKNPPRDTTALRLLGEVSGRVADRRVLTEAMRLAENTGRSLDERLAAFRALADYAVPGTVLLFHHLDQAGLPGAAYVMMGTSEHREPRKGSQRLVPNDRARILAMFQQQGKSDPNATVRAIAGFLAERLTQSS